MHTQAFYLGKGAKGVVLTLEIASQVVQTLDHNALYFTALSTIGAGRETCARFIGDLTTTPRTKKFLAFI